MDQVFNVGSLLNMLMLVIAWSIRNEIKHMNTSVEEVKKAIDSAHERIDTILIRNVI